MCVCVFTWPCLHACFPHTACAYSYNSLNTFFRGVHITFACSDASWLDQWQARRTSCARLCCKHYACATQYLANSRCLFQGFASLGVYLGFYSRCLFVLCISLLLTPCRYDSIQASRVIPKQQEKIERKSRYIAQLKDQADHRKREEVSASWLKSFQGVERGRINAAQESTPNAQSPTRGSGWP
jgi:hypothetical protein